jgi:proteasome lid subunit RPN8/RPN11
VTLELSAVHLQTIQAHAERTYPDECCGLLVGRLAETKMLVQVRSLENAWEPEMALSIEGLFADATLTKSRRYWIAPDVMLAEMRAARQQGLEIIGIYHSHPDHPAIPSECDRQLAWQQYSYIIISVVQGQAQAYHSWVLDDQHQFQSEDLRVRSTLDSPPGAD